MPRPWRVFLALVVVVVAILPSAALAHWVYEDGYVWENGSGKCLWARSEISDGNNDGGYSKTNSYASKEVTWPYQADCAQDWNQVPGYLAISQDLRFWNGSSWVLCDYTDWVYNQTTTSILSQEQYWNRPCGNGDYETWGFPYIWFDNAWRGPDPEYGLQSGYHTLPD